MTSFTRRNFGIAAGMLTAVALSAGALISFSASAVPGLEPGAAAPAFTGVTSTGEIISLADFSGKTVVLEWTNHDCPFVKKHYKQPIGNMQGLQSDAAASDGNVVWVQIISSAPGKQGHIDGAEAEAINAARGAVPAYTVLDPDGTIGHAYGAKTTPHMFVINGDGGLAYAGAIDSIGSTRVSDIATATNYVSAALDALAAGNPVAIARSAPYGCSVKY